MFPPVCVFYWKFISPLPPTPDVVVFTDTSEGRIVQILHRLRKCYDKAACDAKALVISLNCLLIPLPNSLCVLCASA